MNGRIASQHVARPFDVPLGFRWIIPTRQDEKVVRVPTMGEGGVGGADARDRAVQMLEPRPGGKRRRDRQRKFAEDVDGFIR